MCPALLQLYPGGYSISRLLRRPRLRLTTLRCIVVGVRTCGIYVLGRTQAGRGVPGRDLTGAAVVVHHRRVPVLRVENQVRGVVQVVVQGVVQGVVQAAVRVAVWVVVPAVVRTVE